MSVRELMSECLKMKNIKLLGHVRLNRRRYKANVEGIMVKGWSLFSWLDGVKTSCNARLVSRGMQRWRVCIRNSREVSSMV